MRGGDFFQKVFCFFVPALSGCPREGEGEKRPLGKEGRKMPEKNRSGTEARTQARCEDAAGVLMAISVISRKLARKLLAVSQKAGEGGNGDDEE